MKHSHFALVTICTTLLLASATQLSAQTSVGIAKYKGNRAAAISYTFDDGLLEQYTELFPVLQKYGLKATFCVNGNTIDRYERMIETGDTTDMLVREKPRTTWAMLRKMSNDGQEITSHGWAHTNVKKIDGEALRYELEHNDSVIYRHTGRYPRTFFYPGNAKSPEKVAYCERGRVGTRTRQVSLGSKRNAQWLRAWTDSLIAKGEWGIGMTHGISRGYDHFPRPQIFFDHLAEVSRRQDSIWVGTFRAVCAYTKERDNVKITVREQKRKITVTPTMTLDAQLFDEPLTLVIDCPVASAMQGGKPLTVVRHGGKSLVDFLPAGGDITLTKAPASKRPAAVYLTAGQSNTDGRILNRFYPNKSSIVISLCTMPFCALSARP